LAAFRHRDYRVFWFSQLGSLTGNWMQNLAQAWLVLTLTNSPVQLGLIGACQFGPSLLLGLPAGVLADRFPKRNLLLSTQAIAGVLTAVLAGLVVTDAVQLWHIYAVALGFGVVTALDMPARQAFVADVVGKDDLMNAVALNSALFNTTRIIGPAVAGVLLARVGAAACFAINAASYVPVLVALAAMRTRGNPAADAQSSPIERLRQGLAYVRATPAVLLAIAVVGVVATFGMNFSVWVPLLARRDFAVGAGGFGILMSSMGVGSLVGVLTLAFRAKRPRRRLMLATAIAFGALLGALAFAASVPLPFLVALPLMAGVGCMMSTTMATANTLVQTSVPDELRGRVMSIYTTVFAGTLPIGSLVAGATSKALGTPTSIAIGGGVVLLAALAAAGGWGLVGRVAGAAPATAGQAPAPVPRGGR
jgi:MFS family permease